jgi:4-alpha-glucanotransferase
MVAPAGDELARLAGSVGIETGYRDVRGQHQRAGADALVATMAALGVPVDEEAGVAAAVARYLDALDHGVTDPVVAWGDGPLHAVVALPAGRPSTVTVTVRLETGEERGARLDVADLPVLDAAPTGATATVPVRAGAGEELRALSLPGPWPAGYHELTVDAGPTGRVRTADVIVAPPQVATLDPCDRLWGLLAPVYALAGGDGLGAHVGNLAAVADAIDGVGGKVVATLPLLASYLGVPYDPSPYAPVSRRFWNELYVDLAALPELAAAPGAAENLAGLRSFGHAANVRAKHFDYRHQYGYVRGVLEQVVGARDEWPPRLAGAYAEFLAAHPDVVDYARFRAFGEAQGTGWHAWPEPQRAGKVADGDVDGEAVALHAFGQYAMARDLGALGDRLAGRGQRLYLDLPVGANGDGYDTWKDTGVFAWGAGAGAPPDDFFAQGQNWGFPPLRPVVAGNAQLRHVRSVVAHHVAAAGILRLDHAMSLERLYWVPDGTEARHGVYVRYPREALLAVLAVESARSGCVVVGEDLGTVSDTIREAMARHGLLGMYVAEFSQPSWDGAPLEEPTPWQLASIDTHDTPTFAGWLHGLDVDRRHVLGHLDDDGAERARAERRAQVRNLLGFLAHRGDLGPGAGEEDERLVLEALVRFLGDSDAPAVLVGVDDLVGERNPQNVPGTTVDRPNWVQRVRFDAAEVAADPEVAPLLAALQACRLGSHLRAVARRGPDPGGAA